MSSSLIFKILSLLCIICHVTSSQFGVCDIDPQTGVCKEAESNQKSATLDGKPREAERECKDRHKQCVGFAEQGECEINPGWMIMFCAKSCNACEMRNPKLRCDRARLNISSTPIYAPGDMNSMFESLEERFGKRYGVTVLSKSPWVVTFDNFVSDEEVDALIETNKHSFERSTDTGSMNEFGETGRIVSKSRTSSNSWCRNECERHPHVSNAYAKIEEVTGVPRGHYESFQVLQYLKGQRYGEHHDYGAEDRGLPSGPRILTFFLYLSDVEAGGETGFPGLKLDVKPKKGKALLWPSTLDHDPSAKEPRTNHEAKAVIEGIKYAANSWIHLYDYNIPNLWGCTGTFDDLTHD
jgi:prolyl 4-hydroxylase